MPRNGYKCITVTEKLHREIKERAKEQNKNMKEYIEYLLAKEANKEGN